MFGCNGIAFEEHDDAGIAHPASQHTIQRKFAASDIVVEILLLDRMRTFIGDLPAFVPDVHLSDVALLGGFNSLFVGELAETPEGRSAAGRSAVVKAVGASLLLAVPDGEIGLPSQGSNALLNGALGLIRILESFLIEGNRRGGCWRRVLASGS